MLNFYVCLTHDLDENSSLMYQLQGKKVSLAHLCAIWQTKVQGIPFSSSEAFSTSWRPSESNILQALKLECTASWEWNQEEEVEELDEQQKMDDDIDGERQEMWDGCLRLRLVPVSCYFTLSVSPRSLD
jgi:hypothetical protein